MSDQVENMFGFNANGSFLEYIKHEMLKKLHRFELGADVLESTARVMVDPRMQSLVDSCQAKLDAAKGRSERNWRRMARRQYVSEMNAYQEAKTSPFVPPAGVHERIQQIKDWRVPSGLDEFRLELLRDLHGYTEPRTTSVVPTPENWQSLKRWVIQRLESNLRMSTDCLEQEQYYVDEANRLIDAMRVEYARLKTEFESK